MKHLWTNIIKPLVISTLSYILTFTCAVLVCMALVFVMLEWAAGCGETYVDSKGETHTSECNITIRK